jgi:glutathione peroxidase
MNPIKAFITTICSKKTASKRLDVNSIYDIKINTLQLEAIDLSEFKGKYILFVNVASKCGFTKQYRELQELSERFKKKLQVIGVPCNQFGNQEPGNSETIKSFCQVNYGVTFLITEKLHVKGKNQHPLYTWLTQKTNNGIKDSAVKWNFQKYLINEKGDLVDYFHPATKPLSSKIVKHLK